MLNRADWQSRIGGAYGGRRTQRYRGSDGSGGADWQSRIGGAYGGRRTQRYRGSDWTDWKYGAYRVYRIHRNCGSDGTDGKRGTDGNHRGGRKTGSPTGGSLCSGARARHHQQQPYKQI